MDQQLQELIDKLDSMTTALKSLTDKSSVGGGSSGADKIVQALAKLAVQLDGTAKSYKEQRRAAQEFTKQVDKATDSYIKNRKAVDADTKAKQDATKAEAQTLAQRVAGYKEEQLARKNLFSEMKSLGGTSGVFRDALLDATTSIKGLDKASFSTQLLFEGLGAVTEGVTKSFTNYGKALYKGERGASVSAKALTDLVTPVSDFADSVGNIISVFALVTPMGRALKLVTVALGGLIKLLGFGAKKAAEFTEAAAKQSDDLFKSFNQLSRAGVAAAGGTENLFEMMQTLGMTMAELDKMNALLSSNTASLSLFAGTAGKGAKVFSKVAGDLVKSNLGQQLEMLGITAEEQREVALQYMSIQARTGQMQLKTSQQLTEESGKYAKELDLMAQLTGSSRKEAQAAMEANMAESRFRAAMYDAEKRGDKAEMEKLKKAGDIAAMLRQTGQTAQATGTLQLAASGGAMTTPEAIQAEQQLGISKILNDPNSTLASAMITMAGNTKKQLDQLSSVNKLNGNINTIQADNIPKQIDFLKRSEQLQKAAAEAGYKDRIDEFIKTEQGQRILEGGEVKSLVGSGRMQQEAAMTMDSVVRSFNGAAKINEIATKGFKEAVNTFASAVGAKPIVGGGYSVTGGGAPAPGSPVPGVPGSRYGYGVPPGTPTAAPGQYVLPTEGTVTSEFGMRKHPKTGQMQMHGALDIGAKEGSAILAPEGGIARLKTEIDQVTGQMKGYGKYIEILNDQGKVIHKLAHLSEFTVKEGEKIVAGQQIGKVGNTGTSTGAHLHWEAFDAEGKAIDPRTRTAGMQTGSKAALRAPGLPEGPILAQTELKGQQREFYDKLYSTLLEQATKAGVNNPEAIARLGAAQSSLETGYGKSTAGGNNYFGIKGTGANQQTTQEFDPVTGKMVTQKASFRQYGSMQESAADYIKLLQSNQRYAGVLGAGSVSEAIAAQGRSGYATDPDYARKLAMITSSATGQSINIPGALAGPVGTPTAYAAAPGAAGGLPSVPGYGQPQAVQQPTATASAMDPTLLAQLVSLNRDQNILLGRILQTSQA